MMNRRLFHAALSLVSGLTVSGMSFATAQDAASLNPMRAIDSSSLKGFLERPLFDPSRRLPPVAPQPVVAEAAPVVAPPDPPPTLQLLGVIQGERNMAVVHRDGGAKTIILRTGDRVSGWQVTVLPSIGIRLNNGSQAVDYALFTKTGANPIMVSTSSSATKTLEISEALAARNARLQKRTY